MKEHFEQTVSFGFLSDSQIGQDLLFRVFLSTFSRFNEPVIEI